MCYLEKSEYRILPVSGYKILRGCPGCGCRSAYASTGNFRVNANGKQIDVWLIYRCEKCGHTYNLAIYERVAPKDIPEEEYSQFLENHRAAALWWGTRKEVFARNRAEIDPEGIDYETILIRKENEENEGRERKKRLITIDNPYELKIRTDKVAAEICHITRSRLRRLVKEGKISLPQNYIGRRTELELAEGTEL